MYIYALEKEKKADIAFESENCTKISSTYFNKEDFSKFQYYSDKKKIIFYKERKP